MMIVKFLLLLSITSVGLGVGLSVRADSNISQPTAVSVGNTDPCQDPRQAKSNVAINATASVQLIALQSGQSIYICGFSFTSTGTSPTTRFVYGTGSICGTGQTNLSGTFAPTAGTQLVGGWGGTVAQTASANALCVIVAGTSPSIQGMLTYVQK
jgi:hypothetical protein